MSAAGESFRERLVENEDRIRTVVRHQGRGLLRYETEDDLVQGAVARALGESESYTWTDEDAFRAWLATLTRRHIADRASWWRALKRDSSRLLRLTWSGSRPGDPLAELLPPQTVTGPGTLAGRREALGQMARAVALLAPRDRELVTWYSEGLSLADQAERLDISYAAVQRASLRALQRLAKTFRLLTEAR